MAGTVEQVGRRVSGFGAGEAVYGFGHGAFAEYVCVPHASLARKPVNLTFERPPPFRCAASPRCRGCVPAISGPASTS